MKKLIILGILLLLTSISISSDESPDTKIARLEKTIEDQNQTIRRAEKMVNNLKKQLAEQEKENKRLLALCRKAGINTDQANLNMTNKNNIASAPIIMLDELAVGKMGRFEYPSNVVFQNGEDKYSFKVQQIIDEDEMIVKLFGQLVWVEGLSTSGIVNDQYIILNQTFLISGTKTYETVTGGSNTVFVAKLIDPNSVQ